MTDNDTTTTQPRIVAMLLTDDEAKLLLHMLTGSIMQLLRADAKDERAWQLSDIVATLQLQRELAAQQRAAGVQSDMGRQLDGDELAARRKHEH